MQMKILPLFFISIMLCSCGSTKQQSNLSTDNAQVTSYTMFFSGGLFSASDRNDLPVEKRYKHFEEVLNGFLSKDLNTQHCQVVPGTISLSPLGPGGSAIVTCLESVLVEIDGTSRTSEGKPFYRYWVNGRQGI